MKAKYIALSLLIAALLTGCASEPKSDISNEPVITEENSVTETTVSLGNADESTGDYTDTYLETVNKPDFEKMAEPVYYTDIADVPENSYVIEHKNNDGSMIYYVPLMASGGCYAPSDKGMILYDGALWYVTKEARGAEATRFVWTNIEYDDLAIPTMYEDDRFVYKSNDNIVDIFTVERFKDEGYTIGLNGLRETSSGNYKYAAQTGYYDHHSDTVNISNLGATDIYLVSVGDNRINRSNVAEAGFITGLVKNTNYKCDVRTGTKSILASFRANTHIFTSMEQYLVDKFYFSGSDYIEIGLESSMPSGYYNINGSGIFKYVSTNDLITYGSAENIDYNNPFLTFNEDGIIVSTNEGYMINANGVIQKAEDKQLQQDTSEDFFEQ